MWLPLKGSVWQEYDHKGKARFQSPFFGMGRGEHKEFSVEVSLCAILQTEECISAENIFSSSVRGNFLASKSKEPWRLYEELSWGYQSSFIISKTLKNLDHQNEDGKWQ